MGIRSQRFSMLVDDGVVKTVNVEQGGKFEVSDAGTMLTQVAAACFVAASRPVKPATRSLLEALERNGPHGKLDAVRAALAAGADPRAVSVTPARREAPALVLACMPASAAPGVVGALLEAGAPVDAADADGRTALHHAAFGDRDVELESARLLLDHGASLTAVDLGGEGPLHATAFNDNGRMAALLLEAGADRGAKNLAGETPLAAATQSGAKAVLRVLRKRRK